MKCVTCTYPYNLKDRDPIRLGCQKHSLCRQCVLRIGAGGEIVCPQCSHVSPFQTEHDLQPDETLTSNLQKEAKMTSVACTFHEKPAEFCCMAHCLPLCEECKCIQNDCKIVQLIGNFGKIRHHFITKINLAGEIRSIPPALSELWNNRYDLDFPLDQALTLYQGIHRSEGNLCHICFTDQQYSIDSFCQFYCESCYNRLRPETHMLVSIEVIYEKARWMSRSISTWSLSYEQVKWLTREENDLKKAVAILAEIRKNKHREEVDSGPKGRFWCPKCLGSFEPSFYHVFKLPCRDAVHILCKECIHQTPICPIDHSEFTPEQIQLIENHTSSRSMDETTRSDGMFIDAHARYGVTHPLSSKGKKIPAFRSPPGRKLSVLEPYFSVLPGDTETYERGSFEEPWVVNSYPNQVEALSFGCSESVTLCGLSLGNPITDHDTVFVREILMYEGPKARGIGGIRLETQDAELRGGGNIVTDVYFEEYRMRECQVYTLKLKLESGGREEKVGIYHGNHAGRYELLIGSDECCWQFIPTESVGPNERNGGQNDIHGPILRLLYRTTS